MLGDDLAEIFGASSLLEKGERAYLTVLLHFPDEAEMAFEDCPVEVDLRDRPFKLSVPTTGKKPNLKRNTSTREGRLLEWFKRQCRQAVESNQMTDVAKMFLLFPSDMDKFQRRFWHHLAGAQGLISESKGVGANRMLRIYPYAVEGLNSAAPTLPGAFQLARDVWRACQLQGKEYAAYSQGEIEELVNSSEGLPVHIQTIYKQRKHVRELINRIKDEDCFGCEELIEADPGIVLLKDEDSPGYPIHVACFIGNRSIVNCMIRNLPEHDLGQMQDKNGRTAVAVAEHFGFFGISEDLSAGPIYQACEAQTWSNEQ